MTVQATIELAATEVGFLSDHDEEAFFEWLGKISCIVRIEGRGRTLYIDVAETCVDEDCLRELIAVFFRYGIDMKQLAAFDSASKVWFRNPEAYWFNKVFG